MKLEYSPEETNKTIPFGSPSEDVSRNRFKAEKLMGEFFGTDFNFLFSEEMQLAIANNCLSYNWDQYMKFSTYIEPSSRDAFRMYMNPGQIDIDSNMNEVLKESFKNTRKFVWKGVFALLFYLSALITLKDGILPVLTLSIPSNSASDSVNSTAAMANQTESLYNNPDGGS